MAGTWFRLTRKTATSSGRHGRNQTRQTANSFSSARTLNYTIDFRYNDSSLVSVVLNDSDIRTYIPDASMNSTKKSSNDPSATRPSRQPQLPVYRYRHHGHAQLPVEQHPPLQTSAPSVSVSYRMQSAAGVGVIAGVFFCITLFATLALGVFCRKRNTVFAFQKSEQVDYSSAAIDENIDDDLDWFDSVEDDEVMADVDVDIDRNADETARRAVTRGKHGIVDKEIDDEDDSDNECDMSLYGGDGPRRHVETRFDRSVEWQKRQRKRKRRRTTHHEVDDLSMDDGGSRRGLCEYHNGHSVGEAENASSNRQTRTAARRPRTLALAGNALTEDVRREKANDSDTASFFFRSDSSAPSTVDVRRSSTATSFLSNVCRRSISVSASLAENDSLLCAEPSDSGAVGSSRRGNGDTAVACRSQPTTPASALLGRSSAGSHQPVVVECVAASLQCDGLQRENDEPEKNTLRIHRAVPGNLITAGRVEPVHCHSVLTLTSDAREF